MLAALILLAASSLPPAPTPDPAANRRILQVALDTQPDLDLGGQRWLVDRPLFLDRPVTIRNGAIQGTSGFSVCYVGLPRSPSGVRLDGSHWVPLAGKLDGPAGLGRWGLRTKGDSHLAFGEGALNYGLIGAQRFTLDLAIDGSTLSPGDLILLGSERAGWPEPIFLHEQSGTWYFLTAFDDGSRLDISFPRPAPKALFRLSVQLDGTTGQAAVFLDGVQVKAGVLPKVGYAPKPTTRLQPNLNAPMKLNAAGLAAGSAGSDFYPPNPALRDITYCGLKLSTACLYAPGNPGDPQRRADGRPLDDTLRYFTLEPSTAAFLPLTDDPGDASQDRHVTVRSPGGIGFGLFLSPEHGGPYLGGGVTLDGVELRSGGGSFSMAGAGLTMGSAQGVTIRNGSGLFGGAHGLGSWGAAPGGSVTIADSTLSGRDAALFVHRATAQADRVTVQWNGRSTFWIDAGTLRLSDATLPYQGMPWCESVVRTVGGSILVVNRLNLDEEGGAGPSTAVFDLEAQSGGGGQADGYAEIKDVSLGAMAPVPLAWLRNGGAANGAIFRLSDQLTLIGNAYPCLVRHDGGWRGQVDSFARFPFPVVAQPATAGPGITPSHPVP